MNDAALDMLSGYLDALENSAHELWLDDGIQGLTPAAAAERVRIRARELQAHGMSRGRRRLVEADSGADFFLEMCATWLAGASFCPIEPGLPESALREVQLLLSQDERPPSDPERTVLLTSGSTGKRKGVRLTLQSLLDNALASVDRIGMTAGDHLMINIPFHFTSAICHFLACLVSGARFTAIGRPLLARDLIERVRMTRPSGFGGAPLQARWLADGLDASVPLRWLMTSGDDLPASTREDVARKLPGVRLHVFYGLTEVAGRLTSLHPDDDPAAPGSVGRAIAGLTVEVLDESGQIAPAGQLGEVHATGRTLMLGYIGYPGSETGTFATGDIGWKDAAGYLYLAGRRDDVFKVSGSKVSGLAVRESLLRTGQLSDAFVIPVRLRGGLIVVGALIVPKSTRDFDLAALRQAVRTSFESHELPREYLEVEKIPRTGSGKPDRRAIDALLESRGWMREHGGGVYFCSR